MHYSTSRRECLDDPRARSVVAAFLGRHGESYSLNTLLDLIRELKTVGHWLGEDDMRALLRDVAALRPSAIPGHATAATRPALASAPASPTLDTLSGKDFELLLKRLFECRQCSVETTPVTRDMGADLVITHRDGTRAVVQAKRWKAPVGVGAIQEAVASIRVYKADRALVISTSDFTRDAKRLARINKVVLVGRGTLLDMLVREGLLTLNL